MTLLNCFKNLFESIPDSRKIVWLMFLFKADIDVLQKRLFEERFPMSLWGVEKSYWNKMKTTFIL